MAYRASQTARHCFLALAIVCSILGLVAICVSFTTDHWLHYDVNRSEFFMWPMKYIWKQELSYPLQHVCRGEGRVLRKTGET